MTETGTGPAGAPAEAATGQDVPGLDLAAFGAYVTAACPGRVRGGLRASVLAGGKSNITYEVTDGEAAGWSAVPRSATYWPRRTTWPASTG